jgi:excisionase family DNA binding protein
MEQQNRPRRYLSAEEVAELLGVHKGTVLYAAHHQGLPYVRLGKKRMRFEENAVADWFEKNQNH